MPRSCRARQQYTVTTSEFDDVKARLQPGKSPQDDRRKDRASRLTAGHRQQGQRQTQGLRIQMTADVKRRPDSTRVLNVEPKYKGARDSRWSRHCRRFRTSASLDNVGLDFKPQMVSSSRACTELHWIVCISSCWRIPDSGRSSRSSTIGWLPRFRAPSVNVLFGLSQTPSRNTSKNAKIHQLIGVQSDTVTRGIVVIVPSNTSWKLRYSAPSQHFWIGATGIDVHLHARG